MPNKIRSTINRLIKKNSELKYINNDLDSKNIDLKNINDELLDEINILTQTNKSLSKELLKINITASSQFIMILFFTIYLFFKHLF